MYHQCIVPGCEHDGRHALTIRLRRPDTSAVWAPTTGAYLCDDHGTNGIELDIIVSPTNTRTVTMNSWGVSPDNPDHEGFIVTKTTPITGGRTRA